MYVNDDLIKETDMKDVSHLLEVHEGEAIVRGAGGKVTYIANM